METPRAVIHRLLASLFDTGTAPAPVYFLIAPGDSERNRTYPLAIYTPDGETPQLALNSAQLDISIDFNVQIFFRVGAQDPTTTGFDVIDYEESEKFVERFKAVLHQSARVEGYNYNGTLLNEGNNTYFEEFDVTVSY